MAKGYSEFYITPLFGCERDREKDDGCASCGLTNQYVNRALKDIAALAGVTKTVTFHIARHTTATYLLYKGVAIPPCKKC